MELPVLEDGRIPSVRIGGEDGPLRFVPEDIDRWLAEARADWLSPAASTAREHAAKADAASARGRGGRGRRSSGNAADQQSLL